MDNKGASALDLKFIVKELREQIVGGKVRKIYQYEKKRFVIEIFTPGTGGCWLYFDNSKIYLTEYKQNASEPPSFCMFLRKHLMGKTIKDIEQHEFDRIIEIRFDDNILVIELIQPGNVVLCDKSYNIIMPLEIQKWKDRVIKHKSLYKHPTPTPNPFVLTIEALQRNLTKNYKKVGAFLAVNLGLGGIYSNEICKRAKLDREKLTNEVNLEEVSRLHDVLEKIQKENDPHLYEDFVSPFKLSTKTGEPKEGFSEAIDEYFHQEPEQETTRNKEKERIERIIESQEKAKDKFNKNIEERKIIAETIYNNYSLVDSVLKGINKARDSGMGWDEIKKKIKNEDSDESRSIKEVIENEGLVLIEINDQEILLDFRLSVEENAAKYYEKSKQAKRKLASVIEAKAIKEEELEKVPEKVVKEKTVKKKPRKKWYEKFKWFTSSDGFLVIGGKDAKQNEMIYSKYINPGDKVFHADIQGAALVVIQSKGEEVSEEAKREAAEFGAANSKAWSRALGTIDIYCVDPDQISKTPPSGSYLPKGSFAITGQREWFREVEVKLAVGVSIDKEKEHTKVVIGPVLALRKNANYFITIKPGFKKSLELARSIKNKLLMRSSVEDKHWIEEVPLEEFQKNIPSGMGEIVEYG